MTDIKIRTGVIPTRNTVIPVANRFTRNRQQDKELLDKAREYWDALDEWRERCYRSFQYLRGRQWYEMVEVRDRKGVTTTMSEEDYIKEQGKIP